MTQSVTALFYLTLAFQPLDVVVHYMYCGRRESIDSPRLILVSDNNPNLTWDLRQLRKLIPSSREQTRVMGLSLIARDLHYGKQPQVGR